MKLDLTKDHRITLERHGKKLWSYRDNKPDVVEAAVLDYLRDHGFDGYFTERDNYISLFEVLAAWPGKMSKLMITGLVNPHHVYYTGNDCWLLNHGFSFGRIMDEVTKTTFEVLSDKLQLFLKCKSCRSHFSDPKKQPTHAIKFLHAFGVENLRRHIFDSYNQNALRDMLYLFEFDSLRSRQIQKELLLTGQNPPIGFSIENLRLPAFYASFGSDENIDRTEEFAEHVKDCAIKTEIQDACIIARKWRELTLKNHSFTNLDLQLWDETGTAIVEVKAPNDRLRPNQKNTIERARARGERACVIYVSEAN
jgi:hypothetical protein